MIENLNTNIVNKVQLKSDDVLILRTALPQDACNIIDYLNIVGGESDNLLFGCNDINITVEQEIAHIENVNKNDNSLMLLGIVGDKIVSIAHIGCSNSKRIMHNSEIAISVKKDYWGQGVGTAVMTELINFAKNHIFIKNVSLRVKATNINAIKLYKKCGFNQIGVHKNYFYINDKYYDSLLMDLQVKP